MSRGRRNSLPRVSSPKGIQARFDLRLKSHAATLKLAPGRFAKGYKKPGSMNVRKVGRG